MQETSPKDSGRTAGAWTPGPALQPASLSLSDIGEELHDEPQGDERATGELERKGSGPRSTDDDGPCSTDDGNRKCEGKTEVEEEAMDGSKSLEHRDATCINTQKMQSSSQESSANDETGSPLPHPETVLERRRRFEALMAAETNVGGKTNSTGSNTEDTESSSPQISANVEPGSDSSSDRQETVLERRRRFEALMAAGS